MLASRIKSNSGHHIASCLYMVYVDQRRMVTCLHIYLYLKNDVRRFHHTGSSMLSVDTQTCTLLVTDMVDDRSFGNDYPMHH